AWGENVIKTLPSYVIFDFIFTIRRRRHKVSGWAQRNRGTENNPRNPGSDVSQSQLVLYVTIDLLKIIVDLFVFQFGKEIHLAKTVRKLRFAECFLLPVPFILNREDVHEVYIRSGKHLPYIQQHKVCFFRKVCCKN